MRSMVEGACGAAAYLTALAPSTALRARSPFPASRGRMKESSVAETAEFTPQEYQARFYAGAKQAQRGEYCNIFAF